MTSRFALSLASLTLAAAGAAAAPASLRLCEQPSVLNARQQDWRLRLAALARRELEDSGAAAAIVARAGLDLQRLGIRYSHAGVSLRASHHSAWAVRQLYYACDEGRPRLFDQGLAGFVLGTEDPASGRLSIVVLPPAEADALERAALDDARATRLLGATYSANA